MAILAEKALFLAPSGGRSGTGAESRKITHFHAFANFFTDGLKIAIRALSHADET